MISSIWADVSGFKRVNLRPGFNVIIAERSKESGTKDSRNGLGKTSLIEIVHYLLGSSAASFKLGKGTPAADWTFYGELAIRGDRWTIGRSPKKPSRILVIETNSAASNKSLNIKRDGATRFIERADWIDYLGSYVFNDQVGSGDYSPTFRGLIPYFIRRGGAAYNSPFETYQKQPSWEIQVNNAFLLGLDWSDARTFQELRDREELIRDLQRAANLRIVSDFLGARGELEAERTRIELEIQKADEALQSFEVPEQYKAIETDADEITTQINALSNANYASRQLLSDYRESLDEQMGTDYIDVETLYTEAGVAFDPDFLRELASARRFHDDLIRNRREYLEHEIRRLEGEIGTRESDVAALNARRGQLLPRRAVENVPGVGS